MKIVKPLLFSLLAFVASINVYGQLEGKIIDASSGEPLIGANVLVVGTYNGTVTDFEGNYSLEYDGTFPVTLEFSYLGYNSDTLTVTSNQKLTVKLGEQTQIIAGVEVVGQRISEKQKAAALTVESLDGLAIKQTASNDFYSGLGALKGVDLTTASIGFTIVNTRGFNSTSPVRSLQIIDGIDNQSPGLNFSLGNFLGAPDLDIQKVDLVVGASSAYYGPNAFNGVISMETKDPFYNKGVSAVIKVGERDLIQTGFRFANTLQNKNDKSWLAYKVNLYHLQAYDWVADNNDPVYDTDFGANNLGGYDKVNTYGDEYSATFDFSKSALFSEQAGLGAVFRTGYEEKDVVDYNSKNFKGNAAVHVRLKPELESESPELIAGFNLGRGTTVYQGDNRFSLKNIVFYQGKLEYKKRDKYFLRAYFTQEDAGDSYDPYFTSLLMQQNAKDNVNWVSDYIFHWQSNVIPAMRENGYPQSKTVYNPDTGEFTFQFDQAAAEKWIADNQDFLKNAHADARIFSDTNETSRTKAYYEPGSDRFNEVFNNLISQKSNTRDADSGTRFFDQSALYHMHGEYKFEPTFVDSWTVGANGRLYKPNSEGTIFSDTSGTTISTYEFGIYSGIEKKVLDEKLKFNLSTRLDKNKNFDWLFSPAASMVYNPKKNDYLRLSFSSAIRNPTLTDQYLFLNVGPAILGGNLNGVNNLLTPDSFVDYVNTFDKNVLDSFSIQGIKPEQVKSLELGYRTSLFNNTFIDGSYYVSSYKDFIGYVIGVESEFDELTGFPQNTQAYRFATNATSTVTTQGFSIGVNYYFGKYYMLAGNYSWNKLNKQEVEDPIIPAFNTPEHKYNLSISGRDLPFKKTLLGFNINYRWVDGFIFEGSPQFTGLVPSYDVLDIQGNITYPKYNLTLKVGASNALNNKVIQSYGGPKIGRMAYVSLLYDFKKK